LFLLLSFSIAGLQTKAGQASLRRQGLESFLAEGRHAFAREVGFGNHLEVCAMPVTDEVLKMFEGLRVGG
jgi:hypothetical protein